MSARFVLSAIFAVIAAAPSALAQQLISIRGAQVAAEPVKAAAERIKSELGLEFTIVTEGGSADAVAGIGEDVLEVALLSRPVSPRERATYPNRMIEQARFGMQALLIVVSEQVWKGGVRAVTKEQLRGIYEGRLKNWKELGGEDRPVKFFNRSVEGNQWELFVNWLYGDARRAPMSEAEVLPGPADVATAVEFTGGAVSLLEFNAPRNESVHALGIRKEDGTVIEPTAENIEAGRYDMARPLLIATPRKASGKVRRFLDFMIGPAGQDFVKKAGHIPLAELEAGKNLPRLR